MDTEEETGGDEAAPALKSLGERVRALRKSRGWTLTDLSKRSGLAISTLSKIERAELSPTYDRFMRLADGLGVDIGLLLAPKDAPDDIRDIAVTRSGEAIRHETEHYIYDMLCQEKRGRTMTPMLGEVKAHSIETFDRYVHHEGEEFVYVLAGELTLYFGGREPIRLLPGDSAYFRSELNHVYVSTGAERARFLVVCTDRTLSDATKA